MFFSCVTPGTYYDCKEMKCLYMSGTDGGAECGAAFPVSCPAIGDVPKLCWSSGTVCSTLTRCGNDFKSCLVAGYRFDCNSGQCVPNLGGPPPDASPSSGDSAAPTTDTAAPITDAAAPAPADAASSTDTSSGG
jgi:hypothetical protein